MPVFLPLLAKVAEMTIPPLISLVIRHYSGKPAPTPEESAKIQAHQTALYAIKGSKTPPPQQ